MSAVVDISCINKNICMQPSARMHFVYSISVVKNELGLKMLEATIKLHNYITRKQIKI